jgi:transcription elongation factor Elf1
MERNKENSLESIVGCLICGHSMNKHGRTVDYIVRQIRTHFCALCNCRICSFCNKKTLFRLVIPPRATRTALICPDCKKYHGEDSTVMEYKERQDEQK